MHLTFTLFRALALSRLVQALALAAVHLSLLLGAPATQAQTAAPVEAAQGGPVRLRQSADVGPTSLQDSQTLRARKLGELDRDLPVPAPYVPGEFEIYVQGIAARIAVQQGPSQQGSSQQGSSQQGSSQQGSSQQGSWQQGSSQQGSAYEVRRFGSELLTGPAASLDAPDYSPNVPPDYLLQAGDELVLTLWGSVDADLRLQVDRSGRINVPRVGPIMVSGVKYADLSEVISRRIALVFKNFQLSVSLGQLRGLRVYVTGFVQRPGVQVVSSLSTLAQTLMRAGGPSAAGSFRSVQLRRGRELIATFDLYDLLLKGDREADRVVQAEDVIHVGAIGPQVALIGSVNRPAIFELKPGETVDDALRMAGGFTAVADTTRLTVEGVEERRSVHVTQIELPGAGKLALRSGDVIRAFNAVTTVLPVQRQNKRVRIEGEVLKPGDYVMPADSSLADALRKAGGLTPGAFLFGAEFSRESVRMVQQQNYERTLRDMETDAARYSSSKRISSADEAAAQSASAQASSRLIERLRALKPSGRVVMPVPVEGGQLPELLLEDGDRLYIPPRPTAVGVFGSVFNAGSYIHTEGRGLSDYLDLAGGPTRGADQASTFVVRANGSVVSTLTSAGWFSKRGNLNSIAAQPGDSIFVPEEADKVPFVQNAKDWTQIFYNLGVGIAAIMTSLR